MYNSYVIITYVDLYATEHTFGMDAVHISPRLSDEAAKLYDGLSKNSTRIVTVPKSTVPTNKELLVLQALKKVSLWFRTWRTWQQKVFICRVLQYCSRRQLLLLGTSLEPVLHVDFSSSLLALMPMDGVPTFQVQRGLLQRQFNPIKLSMTDNENRLQLTPATQAITKASETPTIKKSKKRSERGFGASIASLYPREGESTLPPVLPLIHSQHIAVSRQSSLENIWALKHSRFSSLPDRIPISDLRSKEMSPRHRHKQSLSLGTYLPIESQLVLRDHQVKQFKAHMVVISRVRILLNMHTCILYCYPY